MRGRKRNGPGADATARRAGIVVSGKPTHPHSRHPHGLAIKAGRELHKGGWNARYVLVSRVTVGDAARDNAGGKQAAEPQRRGA
jgi:hypothetical protein